ncbi:MAG: hypothetical protein AUG09_04275 [Acidobacteria bacterium 13_1_20CM_2_68_7]|nr:MAG: hypothetical protein AUG09_04275 [Acidobacteria bacterium 13_1_20CM_2_68_7]
MLSRPGIDASSTATPVRPASFFFGAEVCREEAPQSLRPLAARLLEGQLARLSRANALIDRRLAQGLHHLHSGSLYRRLGYVRLGDYLTERLGLSLRRCQNLLRTERALRDRPALAAAFEAGLLASSKLQVLAAVATPATQELWLARAQKLTVRQLEEQARAARTAASETEATGAAGQANAAAEMLAEPSAGVSTAAPAATSVCDDDAPDVLITFAAPGGVVALWHWALDLVRRVAGRQEPAWRCAEYLAADYLAGAPTPGPSSPADANPFVPPGSATADPGNSYPAGGGDQSSDGRERDERNAPSPPRPQRDAAGLQAWSEATQAVREALRSLGAAADPDAIMSGRPLEAPDAGEDVNPWELDRCLRSLVRLRQSLAWRQGRLLRTLAALALFEELGFRRLEDFSTGVLGMSPRRVRYLISLERRLEPLPLLLDAYRRGLVTWCQTRLLVRVARPGTERRWIRYARDVTVRRLEDVVTSCDIAVKPGDRPRHTSAPDLPVLLSTVASSTETPLMENPPSGFVPGAGQPTTCRISLFAPPDVADLWHAAVRAARSAAGTHLRDWECLVLFVHSMRESWDNPADADWRRRYHILERDGWRCRAPGCTSRSRLNVHHILYRSHLGNDNQDNLVSLCIGHHQAGVHEQRIRCLGRAPDALWWELGPRPDGPPLARFFGESILGAGERPPGS